MATIGYARTSTIEQVAGFNGQLLALNECDRLYQEQVSSVGERPELQRCLDALQEGDTLVVTKLDRLARSLPHLMQIVALLDSKKAVLRVLDINLNTNTATGRLMLNMIGAIAQFEREMMLERQKEGIKKAKVDGKYKGRRPIPNDKKAAILRMKEDGLGGMEIAKQVGVGRATVYRVLKNA